LQDLLLKERETPETTSAKLKMQQRIGLNNNSLLKSELPYRNDTIKLDNATQQITMTTTPIPKVLVLSDVPYKELVFLVFSWN
jgi:hypothetical protein